MIEIAAFVAVVGFATYRLCWLWRYDTISEVVRERFWSIFPPNSKKTFLKFKPRGEFVPLVVDEETRYASVHGTFIGDLTECPWCLSAYVTAAMCAAAYFGGLILVGLNPLGWFVLWFASWGVSCRLL